MTDATTIPAQLGKLGAPTGTIGGPLHIAFGRGGPWSTVNAHDPFFAKHGVRWNVRPSMLKAMEVIESGGRMIPNGNGFPNWGNMQLTSQKFGAGFFTPWDAAGQKIGADIASADGQIAIAAHVLGGHTGVPGTPEDIFLSNYYPTPCLDCPGQDGHTPRQYLEDMKELERQITAAATSETATTPPPTPLPVTDYAPSVNIPQPEEFGVSCTAYANFNGVKVRQRANPDAAETRKPLAKDEDFEVVYQVLGTDGRIYWVTANRSRILAREARSPDWDAALAKE